MRTGKRVNSPILVADGKHVLTDVWTSVAVFGGILIVFLTGQMYLDAIFAMLVALYVIYEAWHLIVESFHKFLDHADPKLLARIVEIINAHRSPEWIEIHGLRSRANGGEVHIDMHLGGAGGLVGDEGPRRSRALGTGSPYGSWKPTVRSSSI